MLTRQSKLDWLQRKAECQRPWHSQGSMDTLILGAGKPHGSDQLFLNTGNISDSSHPTEFQAIHWTRFSAASTVTIGTLTMALTRLLYLVSAICWGSFK